VRWDPRLIEAARAHPHPLLFVTVSGAHLYGFPSPDSDYDLRGVHLLPAEDVVGLRARRETIELSRVERGLELDVVTHDVAKFFRLLLKRNGYVLEQLLSPLVLRTSPEHAELLSLAPGCATRHHRHHYAGFARTQWGLLEKENPPRVKPLLYLYRVLLTGIHLMRTGNVEANLPRLNEEYRLPWIPELIARKTTGEERSVLSGEDLGFHRAQFEHLLARLDAEHERSPLPDVPTSADGLHDLLVRVRLHGLTAER
jgi:uncharacterized protein